MSIENSVSSAEPFKNKVAESGIITLDLAPFIPEDSSLIEFDIQPLLFMGMILKEKDFRAALTEYDWGQYAGKHVGIYCSADAIVPVWAYMLIASYLQPITASLYFASGEELKNQVIIQQIRTINPQEFEGKRVVIKGCGDVKIPASAYVAVSFLLRPVVKSLMYGEPCSTVPIYKEALKKGA